MSGRTVNIGSIRCGANEPLLVIAGPCVIETRAATQALAGELKEICESLQLPLVFKASFDKTNRTSVHSYRGPGLEEGIAILADVRSTVGVPITTDIHETHQAAHVAEVCDLIQIPAFLARQTDLLSAAAATGRPVNVKKGQFMSPDDMKFVVEKLNAAGCADVLLTERGTFFGYGRLVNDFAAVCQMRKFGVPIVYDATHSVQRPGGSGGITAGNREMVAPLARAAMAVGVDAVFLETHPQPETSPSDAANIYPLAQLSDLLQTLKQIRAAAGQPNLQAAAGDSP